MDRNRGLKVDTRPKSSENVSSSSTLPFAAATAAAFTFTSNTATSTRTSSPCQSISPTPSSASQSSISICQSKKPVDHQKQTKEEHEYKHTNNSQPIENRSSPLTPVEDSTTTPRNREKNIETASTAENDDRGKSSKRRGRGSNNGNDGSSSVLSVVYDIACCDGPVKFHRVLNENYLSTVSCGSSSISQSRLQRPCFESENASSENDENGRPGPVRTTCNSIESGLDAANNSGHYTCGYCRHTFKSQYCYRKHTKRHLLPTRVNDSIGNRQRQDIAARNKREVRLLDLNVQYYPCKICGCKFPSYYFVHKHRKLCHANMEERTQSDEANSTAMEDQESTTSTTNNERQ
ncbi:hypothetical protein ANTPLA_LOCUS688 [Anthophora plagiata]